MAFKISVKTLKDHNLKFTVKSYEVEKGDMIKFVDEGNRDKSKRNEVKRFHSSRCEIDEIKENEAENGKKNI